MNEKDAHIAREVAIDELKTTNKYEALASSTDSEKVKDVVKDIAREEKVHTGEAAALLDEADPEAKPAMKEGAEEVKAFKESAMPSFAELFAQERGRVLEKTGMLTDEGLAEFKRSVFAKAGTPSEDSYEPLDMDKLKRDAASVKARGDQVRADERKKVADRVANRNDVKTETPIAPSASSRDSKDSIPAGVRSADDVSVKPPRPIQGPKQMSRVAQQFKNLYG